MKIFTVVGARPQFIKAASVSRALRASGTMSEVLVHTGQHFDLNMSEVFFDQMSIPAPDYHLGIAGGGHGQMTGLMLAGIERLLLDERPDWVLVYGDTNSTLAGALAAAKLQFPVAHVEAGLRSFNMSMPEEINRILTDRVSRLLFCPTRQAVLNLEREGYSSMPIDILKVGDVMQDAAIFYRGHAAMPESLPSGLDNGDFALATVHRAENTDDPHRLRGIVNALNTLHRDMPVILPLHPRTRQRIAAMGLQIDVHVIDPVGYLEMVWLLQHCRLVLTDSGGLQKEAWFFHRPCVTLRDETEWVELVEAGANILAGVQAAAIKLAVERALSVVPNYELDLFGRGLAAERIVAGLERQRGLS